MTVCSVLCCKHDTSKNLKSTGITFHLFPGDSVLCSRWTEIVRRSRGEITWKPSKRSVICSAHFRDEDMYLTKLGCRRIVKGAEPKMALNVNVFISDGEENDVDEVTSNAESYPGNSGSSSAVETTPSIPENEELSDLDSIFDTPKKSKMRNKLRRSIKMQAKQRRVISNLRRKNRRLVKRCVSFKEATKVLKKERYIDNDVYNILSENVFAADLFNNMCKKAKTNKRPVLKYPPEFRKFCLTLNFYSPKAYNYVRNKFNTCLPHPKTLAAWYRSVNGAPGFTNESFSVLKLKSVDKQLFCALIIDEMSIRQQSIWDGSKNHGFIDMGTGTSDSSVLASEAYVFMLVCLNESWKIPLGYFLVHGLSGAQKVNLINMCLIKCHESGVHVVSLTFDGHATNLSTMELLGCQIKDPNNLKTTFKHPTANSDVAVFLDSSHMIKLVRNHFESKQILSNENGVIDWNFLVKLNELQETEGLHLANKLSRRHIHFRNNVMKVKLATQLLSRSVALALQFCREDLKLPHFENSAETEKFIMLFNNLFDVFNSRNLNKHDFSHPLRPENKGTIFNFLSEAGDYIRKLNLKISRKRTIGERNKPVTLTIRNFTPVLKTQAKTGFLGILICIESLKHLYSSLIENKLLSFISTYKVSQDHIELFFGSIRMHGGHNDNPNARQFKGIYRKLLLHMELKTCETGNCVPLESLSILTCSSAMNYINSTSASQRFDEIEDTSNSVDETNDLALSMFLDEPQINTEYCDYIVGYIAGCVARCLAKTLKCILCLDSMTAESHLWFHKLVGLRDKGGLIYASEEVFKICKTTESVVRKHIAGNYTLVKLEIVVMKYFIGSTVFKDNHTQGHDISLTRLIVEKYLKIRLCHLSKLDNDSKTASSKRQLYRKQVQLQGF